MRIIQLVSSLLYGDGIGNNVLAIDEILKQEGFDTHIYALDIASSKIPADKASYINEIGTLTPDDVIIYHVGSASPLSKFIKNCQCRKVMIYHNITPPDFFLPYNKDAYKSCQKGLEEVKDLKNTFELVITPSEFNKSDLINMGYTCPIIVVPILIPFDDYKKTPSEEIINKYNDDLTNIIFVGRISPNKKQEDVIKVFSEYQRNFNPNSRLFLVGHGNGLELYETRLKDFVKKLGTKNVIFTGHIKFNEILAYYHLSDLFLCQSEHEGFCIPLAEAMFFQKPIVAFDSSAIAWTLGDGGFILKEKNSLLTAGVINRILTDASLKEEILRLQNERLADFQHEKIKKQLLDCLESFIKREK